ncbi:MAG: tetratricopeptide repeat protein, partial [Thermoplasmata archaeon]
MDKAYELLKKVGIEEYLNNNFKKSREALEIVVNLNHDDAEILKIYTNLLMDNGEWEKSINILKNYLVRFPDIPDIELKLLLAESMHKNGNYNESLNIYNRILTSTKDPEILLKTLYGIGVNLFNKNSFIGAKYFIEMSIEKAKELKDYQILARSYNIMGILLYIDLNYEEAIKYLHLSKEIAESINDVNDLISTLINLGHVYSDINIKEGKNYYLEAQKLSEKFWYSHHLIPLYINNSMIYLYNFQVKEMIFILKRAYILSVLMKDYQYSVMAIKNIFYPLIKSGLFNEAWNLLINGVNHAENLGKKIDVIELKVLSNILMLINGDNPNWENDLLLLKNTNISYYVMESEILKQWLYFYSGDIKNTVENFEKNFDLLTENIK